MDQSNNVHLRWNKHQSTLVSVFDALLDNEKLTDCTISAQGQHLRAHKIILSACSPYFEELFTKNYEKHPIIILHDVKYAVVKALMDFMYRGEVNIPHEELSCVLKLSESLQVRGLSGSGCVDDANVQKGRGSNGPSVPPETQQSEPASVSHFTSDQTELDDKVQSFRRCSPVVSSQDLGTRELDSDYKSIEKYGTSINHFGSDRSKGQNVLQEVITPDLDSVHQLPSQRQVLPIMSNSTSETLFSPIPSQSVCNELQSPSAEMAVTENEQFIMPEAVLADNRSADMTTHQLEEVPIEIKSEILETHMEIVEDLTADDNDYPGDDDYRDDCDGAEVDNAEVRRVSGGLKYEENFCTRGTNHIHSIFGLAALSNMTSTTSQTVSRKRFSCHSCGKSYQHPQGLWRHMKLQCGKEPQFQCSHCDYRFTRGDNLKRHMAARHYHLQKK
ncbi:modifier of mdg4-like isoform X7 [Schistocerca serialis cubense]|uniref:modifier of mdg4-like isoform X7 n=1 Tax=Schistocerca serialis cubense TaxID=2023355 RepID=UPI00214EE060|nr:modifier of mdg4-like isoform X7 [Schistocerca serialis cubense]